MNKHKTTTSKPKNKGLRKLADILPEAFERLQRRARGEEKPIPTPFDKLNNYLGGGLRPGLYVLVGQTGTGKTQLALQILIDAAKNGAPSAYIGLELDDIGLVARLLGLSSGVHWSDLYLGKVSPTLGDPEYR